ncbi:cilium assembly protein DZIP1L isoform X1 [Pleurodeles waltl]
MPYQQFPSMGLLSGSMQANVGGFPAFKFQPRREGIDWRRFSAIDVDRVARELDVATLQENINGITFCSLESEKCPYCQQPVDPVLLKVLKMAQMTIEYLLHSQEYLSSNMAMLEERLQSTTEEHEKTKNEMGKMAEELKMVKEESRKRKKMISTQQLLLQAGANNYHKCQLCDKAFMNFSFLQSHVERRHTEITEAERQKKKQVTEMEDGIEELKAKLKQTQALLEEEKAAEHRRRMQELEDTYRREKDAKQDFEKWKEEERTKFQQEMDNLKQLFLAEFQGFASKNSTLEEKIQELASKKVVTSNLGDLHDDGDGRRELQRMQNELQDLREKFLSEKSEWKRKMKDQLKVHQQEKEVLIGEKERLHATFSSGQTKVPEYARKQIALLKSQVKEQAKVLTYQEEKIRKLTQNKDEVIQVFKKPEKAPKEEVVKEYEDNGVETEEVEEEEEEEETDSELECPFDKKNMLLASLRHTPNLIKDFRPVLQMELMKKLEEMGVKKAARGISTQTFRNLKAILQTQQQQKAVKSPDSVSLRAKLTKEITQKVKEVHRSESPLPLQSTKASIGRQRSPQPLFHSQPPTPKEKNVKVIPSKPRPSEPPKPSPRSKISSPSNTPRIVTPVTTLPTRLSTPPFSSEEESMDDKGYLTSPKSNHPGSNQVIQLSPRKQVEEINYDDWSDTDISEIDASPMSTGPSVGRTNQGSHVISMARSLEKQFSGPLTKPFGGVSVISGPAPASTPSRNVVRKLQVSDDSDIEISSFDEITEQLDIKEKPKPNQGPQPAVRNSGDSAGSQASSIWSSSSTRTGW